MKYLLILITLLGSTILFAQDNYSYRPIKNITPKFVSGDEGQVNNDSLDLSNSYILVDGYLQSGGNSYAINELELYSNGVLVSIEPVDYTYIEGARYTIEGYKNSNPVYYGDTGMWSMSNLFDGNVNYSVSNTMLLSYPNNYKTKFIINLDQYNVSNINELVFYIGGGNYRTPSKFDVYLIPKTSYSFDTVFLEDNNLDAELIHSATYSGSTQEIININF